MMKFSKVKTLSKISLILLAVTGLAVSASSCKKDSSETTKNFLSGTPRHDRFPSYVLAGSSFSYEVSGVSHPLARYGETGHHLGYYYTISGISAKADTVCNISKGTYFESPKKVEINAFVGTDTLGTFTLNGVIYPEDFDLYYSSSVTSTFTTIDPEKSIPQTAVDESKPFFTDERDGISYNYVTSDTLGTHKYKLEWMQQNLAYTGAGRPYEDLEDVNRLFGCYYTWEEAQNACPADWRLPTEEEWTDLANTICPDAQYQAGTEFEGFARHLKIDAKFNGQKMWEFWPEAPVNSTSTLHVIPVGYCANVSDNDFKGMGEYAFFWTADTNPLDSSKAVFRYCHYREDTFHISSTDKNTMALPVRCVRDVVNP